MKKFRSMADPNAVDIAIGKSLQNSFGQITRRSFLSGMTRRLLTLAGAGVAAQMFPYFAKESKAQSSFGALCGLHGYHCVAGTPCSGGTIGAKWVQCCQIDVQAPPCPTVFVCCEYTDYCGERPPNFPDGCAGTFAIGGDWCGSAPGDYLCTTIYCGMSWQSLASCQSNCFGPLCSWY